MGSFPLFVAEYAPVIIKPRKPDWSFSRLNPRLPQEMNRLMNILMAAARSGQLTPEQRAYCSADVGTRRPMPPTNFRFFMVVVLVLQIPNAAGISVSVADPETKVSRI
jgi:hypothetical protein